MEYHDIHLASTTLQFSGPYFSERYCSYFFDINFDKDSILLFDNLVFIPAGNEKNSAEDFLNIVRQYFSNAGIYESDVISVLFSDSRVLAISTPKSDLWIDVREGIFPHVSPKNFANLGIAFSCFTVH